MIKQIASSHFGLEKKTANADNRKGKKAAANAPGVDARNEILGYTEMKKFGTAKLANIVPKSTEVVQPISKVRKTFLYAGF